MRHPGLCSNHTCCFSSAVLEGTDSESDRRRQEEEAAEKERKEETDDRDSLRKAREWDDWKDG